MGGYSGKSKEGITQWGHAYPLDLLGAWDFAKEHADGPIDASKVGLLGFSMGGFITGNAFGLDGDVPAAWIDGAPITPKAGFAQGVASKIADEINKKNDKIGGLIGKATGDKVAHLLKDEVWDDIYEEAAKQGVYLEAHLPEKMLPGGPDSGRPVFVTANKKDRTVPYSSSEKLVSVIKKYPKKYDLVEFWSHDEACGEDGETHCVDHLMKEQAYSAKLCTFWSGVFGTDPKCAHGDAVEGTIKVEAAKKLYEPHRPLDFNVTALASNVIMAAVVAVTAVGLFAASRRLRTHFSSSEVREFLTEDGEELELE